MDAERQGVVVTLALLAGHTGPVSVLCQVARALVGAAEHVGKQIEGVAGCRASGGSSGMAGVCDEARFSCVKHRCTSRTEFPSILILSKFRFCVPYAELVDLHNVDRV